MRDDRRICFHSVTFTFKSGRAPSFSCEILTSYYTSPASTRGCRFIRHLDSNGKTLAFPDGASSKESACQCRRCKRPGFGPCVGKFPWRKQWQPAPIFLPGKIPWAEEPGRLQSMGSQKSRARLSD